jgi:3-methyladenine DNA glycosylase AlkC
MFQLITPDHQKEIGRWIKKAKGSDISNIVAGIEKLIEQIRADIPEKKRISYGRYGIIKELGYELFTRLKETGIDVFDFALKIFDNPEHDPFVRSLGVQLISIYGSEARDLSDVLLLFDRAASDKHWEIRECSAGFVRKLIKKYPDEMKEWYLKLVNSNDPLKRRFVCESLRPVADNRWLRKEPEYAFLIISHLFKEPSPYPRTSAGNSLSDWARIDPARIYNLVDKLVRSGNKNSYWIAYRACRNLVIKEPLRVMDLLSVDEYKYKNRIHYRKDYQ